MFCENCGAVLPEGQNTCPQCNYQNSYSFSAASQAAQPQAVQPNQPLVVSAPTPTPQNNTKKNRAIIIVSITLAVIAVVGLIVFLVIKHQDDMRKPHPVEIQVNAQGWQAGDTYIPVKVVGTDFEDNPVDEVQFVDPNYAELSLQKGSYSIFFPASPLTVDGVLYSLPNESYDLTIPEDLDTAETVDLNATVVANFQKLTALDESESQIEDAYEYAQQDPDNSLDLETLKAKALQVHADAVAVKEAADQKAREEAARKARITRISGTFGGDGYVMPPDYRIGAITATDDELIIKGQLFRETDHGYASMGSKTWTFELTSSTHYFAASDYEYPYTKAEFWREFGNNDFVSINIEVNNGTVTKIYTHA